MTKPAKRGLERRAIRLAVVAWATAAPAYAAGCGPVIPTVAALRLCPPAVGGAVTVSAYALAGDDGGGLFAWKADATAPDDGCKYVAASGSPAGRWIRLVDDFATPEMCGAGIADATTALNLVLADFPAVRVRVGTALDVSGTVTVPAGRTIDIQGTIAGTGSMTAVGSLVMSGNGTFALSGQALKVQAGTVRIDSVRFASPASAQQIVVAPSAAGIDLFDVERATFTGAAYGILRDQNATGPVRAAFISHNLFHHLAADGVEWNVGPADLRLHIDDNICHDIDSRAVNGGLCFAVAGSLGSVPDAHGSYENDADWQHDFTLLNNQADRVRQGVHVEYAAAFAVRGTRCSEIRAAYSRTTGIDVACIAIYGSTQFIESGNSITNADAAYFIGMKVVGGSFVASSRDFTFENNASVAAGPTTINSASADPTKPLMSSIKGNTILGGSLTINGGDHENIEGNLVQAPWGTVACTIVIPTPQFGATFNPSTRHFVVLKDNTCADPLGSASARVSTADDATGPNNAVVDAHNNNFAVGDPANGELVATQRVFTWNSGAFPYGIEFQAGDVVIDTSGSGRVWPVTRTGSRTRPGDTYARGPRNGTIISTNLNWIGPDVHRVGQHVVLTDAGGRTVTGQVARLYIEPSSRRAAMDLVDQKTGAPLDFGGLANTGTIAAAASVGYANGP